MCTFNTLLLPSSVDLERVNTIARETVRLTFAAQGNRSIETAVAADARSFVRAQGHCDCGEGLGRIEAPVAGGPTERELRKLRQEGWSEAKIQRWIEQRAGAQRKRDEEYERIHARARASSAAWAELVRRLLDEGATPWVGLFTHDYCGFIETERITTRDVRRSVGVTLEAIEGIESDVAYLFARR